MASLICKTVKGNKYWYIVESRRINGKVRQEVIEYIGNQKKLSERVLGNMKSAHSIPENLIVKSYSYGDSYALFRMADALGIPEILDTVLPAGKRDGIKRSTSLLLAALHRTVQPGSKKKFSSWFAGTSLPARLGIKPQIMTSQHFWDQMDGISLEELRNAEDAITKKVLETYDLGLEKLALDYTNYFTFINSENQRSDLAQRGRNKQKRYDLRQCSLAIVTSKECNIPLFSHVYEGNRNDQTEFRDYVKLLKERLPSYDPEQITLIFDGGSNTKENLKTLDMHYICSFSLSYCKELYQIELSEYTDMDLAKRTVKAYRSTKQIWGRERECILTFSEALYKGQLSELDENLKKTIQSLEELKEKIRNPKSRISKTRENLEVRCKKLLSRRFMEEIIQVTAGQAEIKYEIDEEKQQKIIKQYFGKKLTITDQSKWTTEEIMDAYYEQDCIEKLFRDTKGSKHMSLRPIYHWTDQKIRVHIFICLLGLTLISLLQKEVQANGLKISKDQLIEELAGIRESWMREARGEKKVTKALEEMSPKQSEIWKVVSKI